ncbi:MAG TPA: protein kinase [Bryobacteraceae bacterium]|nr:protein kinase [Bryobacteraceae bacterium]
MSSQQLERVRTILMAAVQLPREECDAFLRSGCSGDQELLAEVEALLEIYRSAGDFLNRSLPELLGENRDDRFELAAGTLLKGRYRIERRLSRSSFATVYLASDALLKNKRVVVKRLDQLSDAGALQEVFASELEALSRLRHPNVVGISDIGTLEDGIPFLVLEYVPGLTLREVLRSGPVRSSRARSILQGLGRALSAVHASDVCHLDIKPENIIISEPGSPEERVTLIDFGIARLKSFRPASHVAGSPSYMAPEQEESPSALCDIYALTLVAFELFLGRLPRQGQEIQDQLPRALGIRAAQAIVKGLEAVPSKRFADVSECVKELTAAPAKQVWKVYAAAAALVIATAGYLWSGYRVSVEAPHKYSRPVPILASPAFAHQPAFSPNGHEIYYTVGEAGRQDIYKKVIPEGNVSPVISDPADDEWPQVSPDGKFLVFIRRAEKTLVIQRNLTNGQQEILAAGVDVDTYSWAAGGKRLVFSGISNGWQKLQVLDIETKSVAALEIQGIPDCGLYHPSLSPDGKLLAFACRWSQGSDDLFVSKVNGDLKPIGKARRATNRKDRIASVTWTPDSKNVLYVGGPLGAGSICRVDPFGSGDPIQVSRKGEQIESLAVAREDWRIAYSRELPGINIWQYRLEGGFPPSKVVASGYGDGEGYLSPDGQKLLLASGRSGSLQEWVADADGGNARQLTNFEGADVTTATWAGNSKDVIVSVRSKDAGERIYQASVEGPATLTRMLEGAMATSVSRDGKWLYVIKITGQKRSIWRTQLAASVTTELIAEDGAAGFESLDGLFFYYAKRDASEGLWRQPLPRGPATRVVERLHRRNLFAIGKNGIFYIAPFPGAPYPALFFQDFAGNAAKLLLQFRHQIEWGLSLSPDERSLVFSQLDAGNSDIMLIDGFR